MKRLVLSVAVLGMLYSGLSAAEDAVDPAVAAYRGALKEFGETLKGELQTAMKAGGPTQAIEVCNKRAPEIAADMSQKFGWKISRTSLKLRNAANAPSAAEKQILERWEESFVHGTDPGSLETLDTVEINGEEKQLYMRGIGVAAVCAACHGDTIAPEIEAKLTELYPDDQARGYKEGDLRGAFVIVSNSPEN